MIQPVSLKKGDKIGIVAPARMITSDQLSFAVECIRQWGFVPVIGSNVHGWHHQYSGTDEERASDLQKMMDDESVKAILAARGGYGTLRIIDCLDFRQFINTPKWVIGYSDITVLHSHLNTLGIASLHATMPVNFHLNTESTEYLRKLIIGETVTYTVKGSPLQRNGTANAEITGGNLSLLYALKGSVSEAETKGKILFIEDLDEYAYHIDRMILSLKRAGKLKNLAGLIVGGFTGIKDNETPFGKTAEEIIAEHVKEYDYPVCYNFPAGHTVKNYALAFGRRAKLIVGSNVSLTFD